jgi:hypothetical protein
MSINMMQRFILEHDSKISFLKILKEVIICTFSNQIGYYEKLFITTHKDIMFNDGVKPINDKYTQPKRLFVCTIGNYGELNNYIRIKFDDINILINTISDMLDNDPNEKVSKKDQFFELCGDGYTSWFNRFDGSVKYGYRVEHRPSGGWEYLDISLCHMYYGK